ncbi:SDR family oxidoreductase [Arthrobacter nitrophenolicus]|uniref:SDR family oxidoreductase n=1 Tax=Arthrobacter nitrophenolicus TaxID=683150 RepID=UPI0023EA6D5D|nr:SDR family oxidoreductase [Arthrobacter nitrophenolicus]
MLGSTSGLGLAVATALADEGAAVTVSGRHADTVAHTAASLRGSGVPFDLSSAEPIDMFTGPLMKLGRCDILILNSGGPEPGAASELSPAALDAALRTLCSRQVELVTALLPAMLDAGWGRIVAIGSSGVQSPLPYLASSNIGRAALAGYLKTLSSEVAESGVTVNMVLPGRIATARTAAVDAARADRSMTPVEQVRAGSRTEIPMKRYGRPDEFAAVVAFLCSGLASYVTGEQVRCDGGLSSAY